MSPEGRGSQATAELRRADVLPSMVRVEWRRGDRVQTSVGFLLSESFGHLVLTDTYNGPHPVRPWTIYRGDVLSLASAECRVPGAEYRMCGICAHFHEVARGKVVDCEHIGAVPGEPPSRCACVYFAPDPDQDEPCDG